MAPAGTGSGARHRREVLAGGTPDGSEGRVDDPGTAALVGQVVGQPVRLRPETTVSYFDDAPIHLVSTAALSRLAEELRSGEPVDRRRFRPNLVIDTLEPLEDGRSGQLVIGPDVALRATRPAERCVMVTMPQPGLPFAAGLLKHLDADRDGCFGLYAAVARAGAVAVGDPVRAA